MFYPAEPDALNALIADMRRPARPDGGVAPKVVVAPHAGVVYSGSVAATAFGPWARRAEPPRRVVIVGPAHRVAFAGVAVHPASKVGEAPVGPVAHAELAQAPGVVVDPRPFVGEHSLEMHLVMLQAMLPATFEIVPILVGDGWAEREGGPGSRSVPRRSPAEQAVFDTYKMKIQGAPYGPAIVSKSKPVSANKRAVKEAKVRADEASATRKNRPDAAKRERSAASKKGCTGGSAL